MTADAPARAIRKLSITAPRKEDEREPDKRPLDIGLITRLISYMRPYAWKRNFLFVCVLLRAIQLPLVAWTIAAVISGPITQHAKYEHPVQAILLGLADTATILAAPPQWKRGIDVWGRLPEGFEVMQSLRAEFDPARTINPGRFAGFL